MWRERFRGLVAGISILAAMMVLGGVAEAVGGSEFAVTVVIVVTGLLGLIGFGMAYA